MKFSKLWLNDFIDHHLDTATLCDQLTMIGLEIDQVTAVANDFSGVVVGEIVTTMRHPNADKLSVCTVNVGQAELLTIVCGANNVKPALKVPVAVVGAKLSDTFTIKQAKLRGIESFGMMCSAVELGLAASSTGLLELPPEAPIGMDIRQYLQLDDEVMTIELTSNRGDCLSMLGIAREVATVNRLPLKALPKPIINSQGASLAVTVAAKDACPHYVGRVIRDINNHANVPLYIKERLRRLGIASISPVVDITNYVMLELGQPLHAFDVAKIDNGITVRYAAPGEELVLLNGNKITMKSDDLVITDNAKALALAGIMGGMDTGVSADTKDIFLESAFFAPEKIINHARNYGLQTDASYRYERGVDYQLQLVALERATSLLLEIVGGQASTIVQISDEQNLPANKLIYLHQDHVYQTLGSTIGCDSAISILEHLGMQVSSDTNEHNKRVVPPSWRFDINIEADIIEELARIHGYDKISEQPVCAKLIPPSMHDISARKNKIYDLMLNLGYHEVITYSFTEPKLQQLLDPGNQALRLVNPISTQLAVMRTSIWPGLVNAAQYNLNRQKARIRVFEIGLRFLPMAIPDNTENNTEDGQLPEISQIPTIAGLVMGDLYPKQWSIGKDPVDFFAVKSDVQAMLQLFGNQQQAEYRQANHAALHPKRSAAIYLHNKMIGVVGEMHPKIKQELGWTQAACLFELDLTAILVEKKPSFKNFSKFPAMQRDIAIVVNKAISWQQIRQKIIDSSQELLHNIELFDIYCEESIGLDNKSLAIRLLFQSQDGTLVDTQVEVALTKIINDLHQAFGVNLRG